MAELPDWPTVGTYVVLAKDFGAQDGLAFPKGLEGVVTAVDHDRTGASQGERGPYMVVFFRDGHIEGDHAYLAAEDLAPDPSAAP